MIFDEIQRAPELLGYIQSAVDRAPGNGKYILTGSHQPRLKAEIAQSLAGRTAIATLLPFSMAELPSAAKRLSTDEILFNGSFCDNLIKLHELASEFDYGSVIYDGDRSGVFNNVPFRNFRGEDFGMAER